MKGKIVIAIGVLFVCVTGVSFAAETEVLETLMTQVPDNAQYEIIQSTFAAKWTFKLDKYTGTVYQIAQNKDNKLVWEEMVKKEHTLPDTKTKDAPNYQLFLSGKLARFTFLMNINTGATWQLIEDAAKGTVFWNPIP